MRCYDFSRPLLLRIGITFARSTGIVAIDDRRPGEISQVPGEPTRAYAALSDPGWTSAPSPWGRPRWTGSCRWPAAFACGSRRSRCLIPSLAAVSPPRGASGTPPSRWRARAPCN